MDQNYAHRDEPPRSGSGGGRQNGNYQKRRHDDNNTNGGNQRQRLDSGGKWNDRRDYNNNRGGYGGSRPQGDRDRGDGGSSRGDDNRGGRGGRRGFEGRGGRGRGDFRGRGSGSRGGGNTRDDYGGGRGGQYQHQQQHHGGGGRGYGRKSSSGIGPPSQAEIDKSNIPIPKEERRTLVLSNIPPNVRYSQIQDFFLSNHNAFVQYSSMDRSTGETILRFRRVEDAMRIWEGGSEGLDGGMMQNKRGSGGMDGNEIVSLVDMGVKLKAVHFTNYILDNRHTDTPASGDRKRDMDSRERGGYASGHSSGHSHHSYPSKSPRYSEDDNWARGKVYSSEYPQKHNAPPSGGKYNDQYYDQSQQQHMKQQYSNTTSSAAAASQSMQSTNPTNNTYHRSPNKTQQQQQQSTPQKKELSPLELQLQQQKQAEEAKAYEEFQKVESAWRSRRQAEYNTYIEARNARQSQLSTLEQKRELLSKQENMLNQQLPLHKKMLTVLKSKNASAADQTKKMKEILSTQTKLLELKKEMKSVVESIEKLKEEEKAKGRFKPSEKRPVFMGSGKHQGGGGFGLDRRTTVLKVVGFDDMVTADTDTSAVIKEHFATFGTVTDVTVKAGASDSSSSLFALVNFANRVDAERAKSSTAKLNDLTLTCTWYNSPPPSVPSTPIAKLSVGGESTTNPAAAATSEEVADATGLYDDDAEDDLADNPAYADYEEEAPENEEGVDYDYDDEEDMVDYD